MVFLHYASARKCSFYCSSISETTAVMLQSIYKVPTAPSGAAEMLLKRY